MDNWFKVMMNIGTRPTFDESIRTLEVNLFDFEENIYGKEVQVRFFEHLRDEVKFDGINGLIQQLQQDEKQDRQLLDAHKTYCKLWRNTLSLTANMLRKTCN